MSIFLGVLLIGLVGNALIVMNINPYLRGVAIGAIIIISVTFGEMSEKKIISRERLNEQTGKHQPA